MKDTHLKQLTVKTDFLLALASGKRRREIHALVANRVSNLGQWEKVALFPSSDFIAKNQLAREGSQSVSPVTIPALTTIVDRQFKHFLQERTHLRHQTRYALFLIETNHPTLLQTSRPTSLGLGPS